MQIHPSVTVSVRPAPLVPRQPAAYLEGTDVAPSDRARGMFARHNEPPLAQTVRIASESLTARRIAGESNRESPHRASGFDLRGHLAEIDRSVRKRLGFFGREHNLNREEVRDLSSAFHAKLRQIYEAARDTDAGPRRVNRAVRRAFQSLRSDLRGMIDRRGEPGATVGVTPAAGSGTITPTPEVPPDAGASGSGSSTTSTIPGVTVSVGTAPPPPPVPVSDPAAAERDPMEVLAEALTQFVGRFDAMMDLLEVLLTNELGDPPEGETSGSTSLFESISGLVAAQETGSAIDQDG